MPVAPFLNPNQKENLQTVLRESADPYQRQRALMLLLRNDGKTYEEISAFIGCSYRSVAHWCVQSNPNDMESLKDERRHGNYRKATPEYITLHGCFGYFGEEGYGFSYVQYVSNHGLDVTYNGGAQSFLHLLIRRQNGNANLE